MKSRAAALWGSLLFFFVAPVTVAGYVPWLFTRWQVKPPLFDGAASRWVGAFFVACGAAMVVECFARFATKGIGTPAPLAPTRHLVISGLYRHVRNPMYVGVVLAILGQALWFGSFTLLKYAALVWAGFFLFVLAYEEPALRRQFGAEYEDYRAQVPPWLPRLKPWRGP
ncbi:MAG: methyltransferase family protein [Steroidobacteraceae bacterium]